LEKTEKSSKSLSSVLQKPARLLEAIPLVRSSSTSTKRSPEHSQSAISLSRVAIHFHPTSDSVCTKIGL